MVSKFITNSPVEPNLGTRISDLIAHSNKLDFLVGYFYFSGFNAIYQNIGSTPLRILIGMDAELAVNNMIHEFSVVSKDLSISQQKLKIRKQFFENIRIFLNQAEVFDNKEFTDSYKLFVKKLEEGSLEIRKTREPNHAKMYLFYIPPEKGTSGQDDSKIIVGSSNLSYQGLSGRNEINIYLQDSNDFQDGKNIFEELWKDSIPLVDATNKDEFKQIVLQKTWLEIKPSPYLMYIRVLNEYFKESNEEIRTPKELTRDALNSFFDVSYQTDAIRDGVAKIKKHSGCIVADVVGLGKSVIAAAIAANLNLRTVIVTPPHLEKQWEDYAVNFGLKGYRIYTSGKLEQAAKENEGSKNLLVIIDEAHRYRNEGTSAYAFLHRLCANNKVILLSATPFNNRPEDIFSLIKLFQIPAHSTIKTVSNLGSQISSLVSEYKKLKKSHREKQITIAKFNEESNSLASQIRNILDPVVIRRTRIDLEASKKYQRDLERQKIHFSKVEAPISATYELGDLEELYRNTLNILIDDKEGFTGARYKPLLYLKTDPQLIKKYSKHFDNQNFQAGQRNMAKFMQQLLVRRFESSKASFIKTLENITSSMLNLKNWYEVGHQIPLFKKGTLPDWKGIEDLTDDSLFDVDDLLQSVYSREIAKGLVLISSQDVNDDFMRDLEHDISLFQDLMEKWKKVKQDPKLDKILESLTKSLQKEPHRKIIIFTEAADTAIYLEEQFKKRGIKRAMMYDSGKASKENRELIRANFDAGYPKTSQKDDFDVLIATDAISEGFSLHRAGTIYNYDIPYNPTRVIQRVGRINRINKKMFDSLFIYNFFPTTIGEKLSHTREISTFKMKLFQAILGSDMSVLTDDETVDGYMRKSLEMAQKEEEQESWDIYYKNELDDVIESQPQLYQAACELPQRCRIARTEWPKNQADNVDSLFAVNMNGGVLLFSKKGDCPIFTFTGKDGNTKAIDAEMALGKFKALITEKGQPVSDSFYPLYTQAKKNSGLVKVAKTHSKSLQQAMDAIKFLLKEAKATDRHADIEYLEALEQVLTLESIPSYYLGDIKEAGSKGAEAVPFLQKSITQTYLDSILTKDEYIESEPEIILLAEELL